MPKKADAISIFAVVSCIWGWAVAVDSRVDWNGGSVRWVIRPWIREERYSCRRSGSEVLLDRRKQLTPVAMAIRLVSESQDG
jgi:hypothetical protein